MRVWQWLFLPHVIVAPEPDFKSAHMMLTGRQLQADFENMKEANLTPIVLKCGKKAFLYHELVGNNMRQKTGCSIKQAQHQGMIWCALIIRMCGYLILRAVLRVLCAGLLLAHEASLTVELILDDGVSHRFAPEQQDEALRLLALHEKAAIS